jgi:hypothetical protein
MSKIVVIHQPDFLPHIGFFHRFLNANMWVALDTVQFVSGTSKSWMNRDKIKTPTGEKWITVAVQKTTKDAKINEIILSKNLDWRSNNVNLIQEHYRKSPFFQEIFAHIRKLYQFKADKMVDFNLASIDMLMRLLDINIERKMASNLKPVGKSNELLVDILKKVSATTYLSGIGAKNYYDSKPFSDAAIKVVWQDFKHPVYPQLHGDFIPYLSTIDLLFNCGIQKSREIIRNVS